MSMSLWAGGWPPTKVCLSCRYLRTTGDSRNISGVVLAHLPSILPYSLFRDLPSGPWQVLAKAMATEPFSGWSMQSKLGRPYTSGPFSLLKSRVLESFLLILFLTVAASPTHSFSKRASKLSVCPLQLKIILERKTCRKRKGCTTVEEGGKLFVRADANNRTVTKNTAENEIGQFHEN